MSVICQNFVQNAWKKDLCSNCFKSVGDHESIEVMQNGENSREIDGTLNGKNVSQSSSNGYQTRNESPPHTTWKTLISERNNKNSQPFKLENGFQGRLLTINKAFNGTDKQNKTDTTKDKPKPQTNGISVKATNGDLKKQSHNLEPVQTTHSTSNGSKVSNGQVFRGNVTCNTNNVKQAITSFNNKQITENEGLKNRGETKSPDIKQIQSKFTKRKSEDVTLNAPLHSILKKSPSVPVDNSQTRRNSNVGFKDEEPLVIGYGGRDFSPEELEWEMASSDGEAENGSDSLDETEDDKVFTKMTKQNTEFNSDNANLLKNCSSGILSNKSETKPSKSENDASAISPTRQTEKANKTDCKQEISKDCRSVTPNIIQQNEIIDEKDIKESNTVTDDTKQQNNEHTRDIKEPEKSDTTNVKTTSNSTEKQAILKNNESKNPSDSITSVAVSSDKESQEEKTSEVTAAKTGEAEISGVDVKNNSEFINGATSLSSSVTPNTTEGENKEDAVMFSNSAETTWQENSSGDGSNEWQDDDVMPCKLLQAINTSLTNRHKMRENSEFEDLEDNQDIDSFKGNDITNGSSTISVSVNNEVSNTCEEIKENIENETKEPNENNLNVQPRESFLHGAVTKPSAIYGPASDLFVSRSNSSSSSSSDEQSKSQISLSINVRVNKESSQKISEDIDSDKDEKENPDVTVNEKSVAAIENRSKPEIPAKPTKPLASEKRKFFSSKAEIKNEESTVATKKDDMNELSYYSSTRTTINLVDPYAESNIYQEVDEKDLDKSRDGESVPKVPARESKLAALAMELEQVRHTNAGTKRQAPAPPKVPDPPLEDPPSCAGRISPVAEVPHSFSTFRGESVGFSSASSTTSTSSQDTETGYASWNLNGEIDDQPQKYSKSKSSFLLTQYSKCKKIAMGYAEDGAKARKKFSLKKLLKVGKESEPNAAFDPNCPNPKAWKYNDFDRPRAKLEIIHPMDLENKSVTVNPGFDSLQSSSLSSFNPNNSVNIDDSSFKNSVSSEYGSYYSDTLSPILDSKQEANYEYIQPHTPTADENEESCSKTGTSSSTSPTPSRSSTASQASTVTSGSSKNGVVTHRPPKPPPPPRAHSLLPGNKVLRNSDGTFKFPVTNGETSSSDEVTVTVTKPQAPKRQCKSVIIRSDFMNPEDGTDTLFMTSDGDWYSKETLYINEQKDTDNSQNADISSESQAESIQQNISQDESNPKNTSSIQIICNESEIDCIDQENTSLKDVSSIVFQNSEVHEEVQQKVMTSDIGVYDNLETSKESRYQTNITIKTGSSNQKEKISKSILTRNKHPPLTKAPARPPPIYSKPQTGNFPRNAHPWKTLEDSYLALTTSNRELLIKLVNQALKKRKDFAAKLNKFRFQWTDFDIDGNQPSSVFAFGEKVVYHATMPQYPEYSLTLVIFIQQQTVLQENTDIKYPMYGKFSDYIPSEYLDTSEENDFQANECLPATILVLDRSNILTVECFSESLSEPLTEENEKEVCFITLQLIQSLKSLQVQGIESIDTSCQNLLLAKTKQDKYHNLIFLYDICYEENDYSSDSCKISLCQYTLLLLFQMLKIQALDDSVLASKFSSSMSKKVFETAFSLLSEEKAVSLSQTKTLFECYLWGVTKVLESMKDSDDYDGILHRWLDIERSNCIKCIVSEDSSDINTQNEFYSQFLIRTTVRNIREVAAYL